MANDDSARSFGGVGINSLLDIIETNSTHENDPRFFLIKLIKQSPSQKFNLKKIYQKSSSITNNDLNADPNESYSVLHTSIITKLDQYFPMKRVPTS